MGRACMTSIPSSTSRPLTRGDIVLVPFPYTDMRSSKRRPAVILWVSPSQSDFTCAFISSQQMSNIGADEVAVLTTHPEFRLTGLGVSSKIRTVKLVTLSRSLVRRWLGRLGPLLTADLDNALVAGLSINTVPYREQGRQQERARLVALHGAGSTNAVLSDLGLPISP